MDYFKNFAKSETGQNLLNALGQQVSATIQKNVEARMANSTSESLLASTPVQSSSATSSSTPPATAPDTAQEVMDSMFDGTKQEVVWPQPVDPTLHFQVHTIVSPIFSIADYDTGHAVVHRPSNTVVYYSDSLSRVQKISLLWKVLSDDIRVLDEPLPVIHNLILLLLNNDARKADCSPIYFAIHANMRDFCVSFRETNGSKSSTLIINKYGDTPVHVAARCGNVELLDLFWDDTFPVHLTNKNKETVYKCGLKHESVIKFITQKVSREVLDEMIYNTAFHSVNVSQFDDLVALKAEHRESSTEYPVQKLLTEQKSMLPRLQVGSFFRTLHKKTTTVADVEKALTELTAMNPYFLGKEYGTQNIFHNLIDVPEQFHRVLLKFSTLEMLNLQTEDGETPAHWIAETGTLSMFIALWSYGAKLDIPDNKGLYPIDVALNRDHLGIVKACIALDAHVKHKTFDPVLKQPNKSCREFLLAHIKKYPTMPPTPVKYDPTNPTHRRCSNFPNIQETDTVALCLDGGGMKGVLALQVLKELEKIKGDSFVSWFNHISGTSTGSIISLGLVKYNNIEDVLRAYFRLKDDVFVGSRPYSGDGLENALLREFGEVTLSQLGRAKNVRISIPVARVDVSPPALCMFRNYEFANDKGTPQPEWNAAKIVRASSAAPSFFPPVDQKYMDGGLIANNPTIDVLVDCQRLAFEANDRSMSKIIVSIGTGSLTKKCENVDISKPTSVVGIVNTFNQILHLKDVFIDQLTAADGVTVERGKWMAEAMGMAYFRFSPNLELPVAIDEKDENALVDAMLAVKYDTVNMRNDMLMLAKILK